MKKNAPDQALAGKRTHIYSNRFLLLVSTFLIGTSLVTLNTFASTAFHVCARDSATGRKLIAQFASQENHLKATGSSIQFQTTDSFNLTVQSDGFLAITSRFSPEITDVPSAEMTEITFWLDPIQNKDFHQRATWRSYLAADTGLIRGNLFKDAGIPLPGYKLMLNSYSTTTDQDGYFELYYPYSNSSSEKPDEGELTAISPSGHIRSRPVLLMNDVLHIIWDFDQKTTVHKHVLLESGSQSQVQPNSDFRSVEDRTLASPPATIRLGTNCSCWTCNSVSVMSLETYVKRGLNDEWIASWNAESLKAGSIAYRSYGAYYVGPSGTFDICNNTCCQVNDSDTSLSTDEAAETTAGMMLERGQSIFRAEYSAQNNSWDDPDDGLNCTNSDLSCGNGFNGSPSNNWPCLSDSVGTGHGCFGHGRGMSQWGTQYWARDHNKDWVWITDHYYNDNGNGSGLRTAEISFPFQFGSIAVTPDQAQPGDRITLELQANNLTTLDHHLLLGASLYSDSTGYVNDPDNDILLLLPVAGTSLTRFFDIPPDQTDGSYDVLLGVYIDINQDGNLQSGDYAIALLTSSNALTISTEIATPLPYPKYWWTLPLCHTMTARVTDYVEILNGTCQGP